MNHITKYQVLYSKDGNKKRMVFHDGILQVKCITEPSLSYTLILYGDSDEQTEIRKDQNFKPSINQLNNTTTTTNKNKSSIFVEGEEIVFGMYTVQIDSILSSSTSTSVPSSSATASSLPSSSSSRTSSSSTALHQPRIGSGGMSSSNGVKVSQTKGFTVPSSTTTTTTKTTTGIRPTSIPSSSSTPSSAAVMMTGTKSMIRHILKSNATTTTTMGETESTEMAKTTTTSRKTTTTLTSKRSALDTSSEEEEDANDESEEEERNARKKEKAIASSSTSSILPMSKKQRTNPSLLPPPPQQPQTVPERKSFVSPSLSSSAAEKRALSQSHSYSHSQASSLQQPTVSSPPVAVKVDSFLLKVMKPHQIEGATFILKALTSTPSSTSASSVRYFGGDEYSTMTNGNVNDPNKITGVILADEMGVGKTLTTISVLYAFAQAEVCKSIVVTPSTLVDNWSIEIKKWLGMRVSPIVIKGGGGGGGSTGSSDPGKASINTFAISRISRYPILIISYEMVKKYITELNRVPKLDLIVCDEGHRLKNVETKTMEALNQLKPTKRIILTGTPVQNNLDEFYALLSYVAPAMTMNYGNMKCAMEDLSGSEMLSNIFLRRTQQDVLSKILPPRIGVIIRFPLSIRHAQLYDQTVDNVSQSLEDGSNASNNHVLPALLSLRKICCTGDASSSASSTSVVGSFRPASNLLKNTSSSSSSSYNESHKLLVLERLIHHIHSQYPDDKIVIVSGSMEHLDAITDRVIHKNSWGPVSRIDGSVASDKRQALVDAFNTNHHSQGFIMLLSTKAGGVGINLVGANRLIMADLDWNPAHDKQAMNRIWRPGQTKTAYIYRLVTIGTIEDSILMRQSDKSSLESILLDASRTTASSTLVNDPVSQHFHELAYPQGRTCCEVIETLQPTSFSDSILSEIQDDLPLQAMYTELSKKFPISISLPNDSKDADTDAFEQEESGGRGSDTTALWKKEVDFYDGGEDFQENS